MFLCFYLSPFLLPPPPTPPSLKSVNISLCEDLKFLFLKEWQHLTPFVSDGEHVSARSGGWAGPGLSEGSRASSRPGSVVQALSYLGTRAACSDHLPLVLQTSSCDGSL